jgi:hypothetical protein
MARAAVGCRAITAAIPAGAAFKSIGGNALRADGIRPGPDNTISAVDALLQPLDTLASVVRACSLLKFDGKSLACSRVASHCGEYRRRERREEDEGVELHAGYAVLL